MNETRRAILEALEAGTVSGPELAESLGISRAAVWKHIEGLREAGIPIESTGSGYVLPGAAIDAYTGPTLEYGLEAPFEIEYHDQIGSTNDRARELATEGATDVVVVADEQTGGRGRLERAWSAPSGGVWLTVVNRPTVPPARAPLFTLAAAVATTEAARAVGVDAAIKWPNDVIVPRDGQGHEYDKLAGILTEMEGETDRIEWLIVGIGCNVNIDLGKLPEGATSVEAEVGTVDRRAFVQALLERFEQYRTDLDSVTGGWLEHTATIGQRVRVEIGEQTVVGDAVDITEMGALVVETEDGTQTVSAGDCDHLRPVSTDGLDESGS